MNPDDIELMGYVDGTLPAHAREAVERALNGSSDAMQRVARLRASRLPYAEAFAQQALPPVPESLSARIADMARAANKPAQNPTRNQPLSLQGDAAAVGRDASANDAVVPHPGAAAASATIRSRSRLRVAPAWLAVAFIAGAFACGFVLRLGSGIGAASTGGASVASVASVASAASVVKGMSPWVAAAASYQQLYSRDTLANIEADPALVAKTTAQIHDDDGLAVRIPDLSAYGLTFKRVQRLRFNDKPLVQIVYLPERGAPVALCVMKEAKPDAGLKAQQVASMTVVTWRQSELGYALIGPRDGVDLSVLSNSIATRRAPPLFGSLPAPIPLAALDTPVLSATE
ncbi:anti-sigma factor family protein [Paraburkholderia aromaticivorans]|uniref:anti-sigma factor family protein n=1 Tax=Paraburkholderia aromaticivorans TaxID=2026199 RepID=UPI00197D1BE6|nr:anti-sigma factor [Paraburkholderia aromaticivorans]